MINVKFQVLYFTHHLHNLLFFIIIIQKQHYRNSIIIYKMTKFDVDIITKNSLFSIIHSKMLFFILILCVLLNISESSRYRISKTECSSSNLTCLNSECRLRSTSRMNQTLSLGCNVTRNLTNPQVRKDIFLFYKINIQNFLFR